VCEHVSIDPDILSGAPCLDGSKLSVLDLVSFVRAAGFERFLYRGDYDLSREGLVEILEYCSARCCEIDRPPAYCWGCRLLAKHAGMSFEENCLKRTWLGPADREAWEGVESWRVAAEILADARLGANPWSGPEVDDAVLACDRPPDARAGLTSLEDRVEVNDVVLPGTPVVTGTRLTVAFLLELMSRG